GRQVRGHIVRNLPRRAAKRDGEAVGDVVAAFVEFDGDVLLAHALDERVHRLATLVLGRIETVTDDERFERRAAEDFETDVIEPERQVFVRQLRRNRGWHARRFNRQERRGLIDVRQTPDENRNRERDGQ